MWKTATHYITQHNITHYNRKTTKHNALVTTMTVGRYLQNTSPITIYTEICEIRRNDSHLLEARGLRKKQEDVSCLL